MNKIMYLDAPYNPIVFKVIIFVHFFAIYIHGYIISKDSRQKLYNRTASVFGVIYYRDKTGL